MNNNSDQFSRDENTKNKRVNKNATMFYDVTDAKHSNKRKKVVQEDYNDNEAFRDDLVRQYDRQNRHKINFVYEDGKQRPFGQTMKIPEYGEKDIHVGERKQFIYEGARDITPYNAPKKKKDPYFLNRHQQQKKRGEDTRSLYDDPRLQRLRQTFTRKLLQKIDGELDSMQGCQWDPLMPHDKIPQSFYMKETFKQRVGPQNLDDRPVSEYNMFKLFFCDAVYARIIKYTEAKFQQHFIDQVYAYCHGLVKFRPHHNEFKLHERELDAFFSVHLFFGIVRLSNMRDYFRQTKKAVNKDDPQFKYKRLWKRLDDAQHADDQYSYFVQQKMAQILSYQRFKQIKKYMGLSGPEAKQQYPHDTLYRIRDFITDQNEKYKRYYYPDEYLCVDEGMIPFGGKAKFKVYNPDKPTQWGIKEYLLCDAVKSYTLHIQIYHGHSTWDQELKTNGADEDDLSSRTLELVLSLMKPYEGKGHKVVMDNYYTSWQLLTELKNRGIGGLGTIRHNRTGLKKQDFVKDHFQQIYEGVDVYKKYAFYLNATKDSILIYFQGTADKEVAMISNFLDHSFNEDHKFSFSKKHYYVPNVKIPYIISVYNKYKGGVDRRNAYMVNFRSKFSVRKWWQSIFERFFETAIYNAFCIYKHIKRINLLYKRGLYRDFRVNLMVVLSDRYKEYQQRESEVEKTSQRPIRLDPHTYMVGEVLLMCQECGMKTKNFCQECTMMNGNLVGICVDDQEQKNKLLCARFHRYKDYIQDKHKIVVDKKFQYTSYDAQSLLNFYQEVGELHKSRHQLKVERTTLITEQYNKKATAENLNQIVTLLKTVQTKSKQDGSSAAQDTLKQLIKDQLSILKGQKQELKVDEQTLGSQGSEILEIKSEGEARSTSESEDIDKEEMLESDFEAKALLAEQEGASDDEEDDYQDRETNQFKRFQLNFERTKSLHLKNNKQKKKSKQDTKKRFQVKDIEECSSSVSREVDEFQRGVLHHKHKEFPFQEDVVQRDGRYMFKR